MSLALLLLLGAAQVVGVTEYTIRVIGPLPATTVAAAITIPAIQVRCGLVKREAAVAQVLNPRAIRWDDPSDDTKDCEWEDANGAALRALPISATNEYTITIRPRYETGLGPFAAADNTFKRVGRNPADPLDNVRLVK